MIRKYPVAMRAALVLLLLFGAFEAYSAVRFYRDLDQGRHILSRLENRVDIDELNMSEAGALATREDFAEAGKRFRSAQTYASHDVIFNAATLMPFLGKQVKGIEVLVDLGAGSSEVGFDATGVLLAYSRFENREIGRAHV